MGIYGERSCGLSLVSMLADPMSSLVTVTSQWMAGSRFRWPNQFKPQAAHHFNSTWPGNWDLSEFYLNCPKKKITFIPCSISLEHTLSLTQEDSFLPGEALVFLQQPLIGSDNPLEGRLWQSSCTKELNFIFSSDDNSKWWGFRRNAWRMKENSYFYYM